ncbi:hypothetical protein CsSME_00017009 [Camellia sinensis var. sinensis]
MGQIEVKYLAQLLHVDLTVRDVHVVGIMHDVFGARRTTMFILGMISVFIGISLLAPDEAKGKALVSPIERYAVVPDDNVKRINFAEGKI